MTDPMLPSFPPATLGVPRLNMDKTLAFDEYKVGAACGSSQA
jgi:hypothetical protein